MMVFVKFPKLKKISIAFKKNKFIFTFENKKTYAYEKD